MNAPIILFAYARLSHLKRTVDALLNNKESCRSDLIIYSDAPKSIDKHYSVCAVREFISKINGFRSVSIRHQTENLGLSRSVISGVSEVLSQYDRAVVVEDDIVTSPYFLEYMNEYLSLFAENDRVISIHGYVYPISQIMPEAFFLRGADCWGWATWRRGWNIFNPDGKSLMLQLKSRNLLSEFDFNGSYKYSRMLRSQIDGKIDSWAIRWYASAFLADKLTLYPGCSLVDNIGNDNTGVHCGSYKNYDLRMSQIPIKIKNLLVEDSQVGRQAFERFFRDNQVSLFDKIVSRARRMINQIAVE
jgi:hypothetical protein